MDDLSAVVGEDDEDEEQPECDGRDEKRSAAMIWFA
jgi:hypothetical protein